MLRALACGGCRRHWLVAKPPMLYGITQYCLAFMPPILLAQTQFVLRMLKLPHASGQERRTPRQYARQTS